MAFFGFNFGFARRVAVAPASAEGDDMALLTKTFTLAELTALGAVDDGQVSFGSALPAGARVLAITARNKGDAFGTTVGNLYDIRVGLRVAGQATDIVVYAVSVQAANSRLCSYVTSGELVQATYPFENGFTPAAYFVLNNDTGCKMNTLNGGASGIEVTIIYAQ